MHSFYAWHIYPTLTVNVSNNFGAREMLWDPLWLWNQRKTFMRRFLRFYNDNLYSFTSKYQQIKLLEKIYAWFLCSRLCTTSTPPSQLFHIGHVTGNIKTTPLRIVWWSRKQRCLYLKATFSIYRCLRLLYLMWVIKENLQKLRRRNLTICTIKRLIHISSIVLFH